MHTLKEYTEKMYYSIFCFENVTETAVYFNEVDGSKGSSRIS